MASDNLETAAKKTCVLFDVTRLIARSRFTTPTGIDRVDLAYLRALDAAPQFELRLVVFDALRPQLLAPGAAKHLIGVVNRNWQSLSEKAPGERFTRLRSFLEAPSNTLRPALTLDTARESTSIASGIFRAALAFRRPIGAMRLRRLLAKSSGSVYVNTSHGHLFRSATARWLRESKIASVFLIHDLIPIEFPQYSRVREPARHRARLETVAAHAHAIIVNSQATAEALTRHLQTAGKRLPPIAAFHLGVDLPSEPLPAIAPVNSQVPYFVCISTIEPRKNHQMLLQIWQRWVEEEADKAPRLVLVGRRGWENQNVFNLLDRSPALAHHVVECPGLSDREIVTLMRGARALLSPSFAEGFGLPVAEALAMGTPVIASSIAAHREIGGSLAEYIDPLDGPGWLEALRKYSKPDAVSRGTDLNPFLNYQAPTWAEHFKCVLPLIEQAAHSAPQK